MNPHNAYKGQAFVRGDNYTCLNVQMCQLYLGGTPVYQRSDAELLL